MVNRNKAKIKEDKLCIIPFENRLPDKPGSANDLSRAIYLKRLDNYLSRLTEGIEDKELPEDLSHLRGRLRSLKPSKLVSVSIAEKIKKIEREIIATYTDLNEWLNRNNHIALNDNNF